MPALGVLSVWNLWVESLELDPGVAGGEPPIAELLARAKSADEAEDALHGPDKRGDELPQELARRESRLARIQKAKKALEIQALETARVEEARRDTKDEQRRAAGETVRQRQPVDTAPKPKAQYNFTDPESKIMKVSNKGFDQCGNAQAVVNEKQMIIATDVTPQANDKRQVAPVVEQSQKNLQAAGVEEQIGAFDADTGYFSEENVSYLKGEQIDPPIATEQLKHHEKIPLESGNPLPKDLTVKQRMARKLRTKEGRETYAKRDAMIETVFGQIKRARGFRQFLLRGMAQMRGEWRLVCMTHNLLKLFRSQQVAPPEGPAGKPSPPGGIDVPPVRLAVANSKAVTPPSRRTNPLLGQTPRPGGRLSPKAHRCRRLANFRATRGGVRGMSEPATEFPEAFGR